jgi:N-methylhydantoinase A
VLASLAIDIGGTFTDVVLVTNERVVVEKTLTTHEDLLEGFFRGIHAALAKAALRPADIDGWIVHATTVVTNALIERKGSRIAMVFTQGFGDILRIRDERRYDMYDPQIEFPAPLCDPEDQFTIDERTLADGTVSRPVSEDGAARLADALRRSGVSSVGICLLHSYRNGANEEQLARRLERALPNCYISVSSRIAPQLREYVRASTTAVNAYTRPITEPYLEQLEKRLVAEGFTSHPLIMLSSGGVVGSSTAGRIPVRMIESGPAAGALGAAHAAHLLDLPDLLSFDMGGTTAKVCLVRDGQPLVSGQFEVDRVYRFKEGSGLPVAIPCIDLIEIGAGGGSIAHIDALGLLKVGPQSAGSRPGPACYGRGGREPTVTDADVVLGLIDPDRFLGGTMQLDSSAATDAVGRLASRLGRSTVETARGICRLVCETMAGAVKAHAAERGVDFRGVPLLAFGGAGPVHACEVAEILKSETVIFPPLASVYSAFGTLVTPPRLDLLRSSLARLSAIDWADTDRLFDDMERQGLIALTEAGCPAEQVIFRYAADVRYVGQHYDLLVDLPARPDRTEGPAMIRWRFEDDYERRYRLIQRDVPVEVVNWRVVATGSAQRMTAHVAAPRAADLPRARRIDLWREAEEVSVLPRTALVEGVSYPGPLILEEDETTLVIPPHWSASLRRAGYVLARRGR